MKFFKSRSFTNAFFWQISIILATLFRIEGIGFLILLPFSLFSFNKDEMLHSTRAYFKANFLNISLLLMIFGIAFISNHISIKDFGRLQEVFSMNAYQDFFSKLTINAEIMSSQVLGKFLQGYTTQGLLLTLAYVILAELIKATGRLNSLLGLLGIREKEILVDDSIRKILYFSASIAAFIFIVFTIKSFIITHRYVLAFSFVWMIFAAFYLAHLCQSLKKPKNAIKKIFTLLVIIFLCVNLIRNLLPRSNHAFIQQDAVAWLKVNNTANKPVFFDESRARYYANEPFMGKFNRYNKVIERYINDQSIVNYQYLLVTFSNDYVIYESYVRKKTPEFIEVKRFCVNDNTLCSVIFKKK